MRTKRAFDVRVFFIISKGLFVAKNCLRPESAPLRGECWQMPNTEQLLHQTDKSSHRRCSIKNLFLPVLESLLNKIASLQDCIFARKRLQHRCFSVGKFLRTYTLKNATKLTLDCLELWFWPVGFKTILPLITKILQKQHSLLSQSFKHNSALMSSFHLNPYAFF